MQSMAHDTLQRCERNKFLHNAECKFEKVTNNIYHFYEKDDTMYCSLLSPDDWKGNPPHQHYGSFFT